MAVGIYHTLWSCTDLETLFSSMGQAGNLCRRRPQAAFPGSKATQVTSTGMKLTLGKTIYDSKAMVHQACLLDTPLAVSNRGSKSIYYLLICAQLLTFRRSGCTTSLYRFLPLLL